MSYFLLLLSGLATFWLLMSGYWDNGLLLFFGLLSVLFSAWFGVQIEKADPRQFSWNILKRLPGYLSWLTVEIIKSNIDVIKRVWFPTKYPISPTMKQLPVSQKSRLGRTIYANSITLTPGTVSIELSDDIVLVHALTEEGMTALESGEMDRRVSETEGGVL